MPSPELALELRQQNARYDKYYRIWGVALVIIIGQIMHAAALIYQTWVFAHSDSRSVPRNWWWLILFLIYLTNEIVVTVGVLYFLRASPSPSTTSSSSTGDSNTRVPLLSASGRRRSSTSASYGLHKPPGDRVGPFVKDGRWSGARGGPGSGSARRSSGHARRRSSESSPLRQPALWEALQEAGAGAGTAGSGISGT